MSVKQAEFVEDKEVVERDKGRKDIRRGWMSGRGSEERNVRLYSSP